MDRSEQLVQRANANLNSASTALQISYNSLNEIDTPLQGNMQEFLASRTLLDSSRGLIKHNQEWIVYAKKQVNLAKERLKKDMIEHEKFKYLELQEIQQEMKKRKIQEMKDLDEVALMTFTKKGKR